MFAAVFILVFLNALITVAVRQGVHRQTNLETSLAMTAALHNLEQIRSVPFAVMPTLDGAGFDVLSLNQEPGGLRAISGDDDGLPGQLSVKVDQSADGATIYLVTATVSWTGVSKNRELRFDTLIGERK